MGYRMNLSKIACAWLLVGLLGAGAACGDDDDDADEAGTGGSAGSAGAKAGAGGAGTGGTKAGSGGASGAGSGGGAGMIAPIMCAGAMCGPTMSAQGPLMPCCDAANAMACGAVVGMMGQCVAVKQEGVADPSCPSAQSVLGMAVPGCCKMGNKCGLMSGTLMGCVERTQYPPTFLMGMMALTAANCGDGMDGGTE